MKLRGCIPFSVITLLVTHSSAARKTLRFNATNAGRLWQRINDVRFVIGHYVTLFDAI
jgi:hypothetical protein